MNMSADAAFEAGRQYAEFDSQLEEMFGEWAGKWRFDNSKMTLTAEVWAVLRLVENDLAFADGTYATKVKRARIIIDQALADYKNKLLNGVTDD